MKFVFTLLLISTSILAKSQLIDAEKLDTAYLYTSMEEALQNPERVFRLKLRHKFEKLPDGLERLVNLNELNISKNRLTELPEAIGSLAYLQKLDISKNNFEIFPQQICRLSNLKYLSINRNLIDGFPACIGNLVNLEYMDCWSNNLSVFPPEMKKMVKLKELDLREINLSNDEQLLLLEYFPKVKVHFSNSCDCGQ